MKRIQSFNIDHTKIEPGFYVSRVDYNIVTYDLRTRKPNSGDYMDNLTMHSVEHMFATIARNSYMTNSIIYFGPMGCQTGFYFIVKDVVDHHEVFHLVKKILEAILDSHEMYGDSAIECGNYQNLDLGAAKIECRRYLDILNKEGMKLNYEK